MNKYMLIIMAIFSMLSCNEENWPAIDETERNFFAVPDDATGEEADLRRSFFDNTGVYLLFSDTLGVIEETAMSGELMATYRILDMFYDMGVASTVEDSLVFEYYSSFQEKQEAADFLQDEVLPELAELFYPYSILLLEGIIYFDNFYGLWYTQSEAVIVSGLQSSAMGLGNVAELSEDDKEDLKNELLKEMVIYKIDAIPDEEFDTFYSYSEGYYDTYSWNLPSPVQSIGFLESGTIAHEDDKLAYVEEIYALSEEEFRENYADYPVVISKMEEVVSILQKYGVKIYE